MYKILYALQTFLWVNLISAEWFGKLSPNIRDLTESKLMNYFLNLPLNKKYLTDSEINYAIFDDISEEANRNAEKIILDYQKYKKRGLDNNSRYYVFSNPEVMKDYMKTLKPTHEIFYEDLVGDQILRRRNDFNDDKPYGKLIEDKSIENFSKSRIHSSVEEETVRHKKPKYISEEDKRERTVKDKHIYETKRTTREREKSRYSNEKYDLPKRTTKDNKYDYIKPKRLHNYNKEDYRQVRKDRSKSISNERIPKKRNSYARTSIPHFGKKRIYDY